ncbi:MAG: Ku protein [Nitrospirota bacterium]
MQPIWSGSITFGLINIPVRLYAGSQSHTLDLDMLRKTDLCPIKYLRICEIDKKEVPYEEIVKGYEYSDGEYVVLTDDDFENADLEQTYAIDIMDFIKEDEIDSRFFEKPYYLEPDRGGDKAYALLREALKKSGKVGVASFVLRNRGHLGIVKPHGNAIVLNQIRYSDEVRDLRQLKLPDVKNVREKEIDLALTFIGQLSEKFKPEKYRDTYTEALKRMIEDKAKGRKPLPKGKLPQPTKVIDLMALLKKSLKEQGKEKGKEKRRTAA